MPDVIGDCARNDGGVTPQYCTFNPVSSYSSNGSTVRTSPIQENCKGIGTLHAAFGVSYTNTQSLTEGYSTTITDGISAGGALFQVMAQASYTYDHSTTLSNATSNITTIDANIPNGYEGWSYFTPRMENVRGWLHVHYNGRVFGHYDWYYPSSGSNLVVYTSTRVLSNGVPDGRAGITIKQCGHN